MVLPAVRRLMSEVPNLRFETFGTIGATQSLSEFGSRVGHHRGVPNYALFLARLSELGWWVGIAPLEDTPFNRCKADTKMGRIHLCWPSRRLRPICPYIIAPVRGWSRPARGR